MAEALASLAPRFHIECGPCTVPRTTVPGCQAPTSGDTTAPVATGRAQNVAHSVISRRRFSIRTGSTIMRWINASPWEPRW